MNRSKVILYAYEAVLNADILTEGDKLILHALGVTTGTPGHASRNKPLMKRRTVRSR